MTRRDSDSPIEATLDLIGGRWKGVLLFHLLDGTKRFNELRRLVPQVTHRIMTLQLRELERAGLVQRVIHPEIPPKVEYSLTELGLTLSPLLLVMKSWGETYMKQASLPR